MYRTRDGVIPFGAFWVLYREIPVHQALARISEVRAVVNALGLAFARSQAQQPKALREDLKAARLEG